MKEKELRLGIAQAIASGQDIDLSRLNTIERDRIRAMAKRLRRNRRRHAKASTDP